MSENAYLTAVVLTGVLCGLLAAAIAGGFVYLLFGRDVGIAVGIVIGLYYGNREMKSAERRLRPRLRGGRGFAEDRMWQHRHLH